MTFELSLHRVLRTVSNGLIQLTDILFPRNRKGSQTRSATMIPVSATFVLLMYSITPEQPKTIDNNEINA